MAKRPQRFKRKRAIGVWSGFRPPDGRATRLRYSPTWLGV